MSNEIKTYRSRETVEAFVFDWPDDKPVKKGDMVNGFPVQMDAKGACIDVTGGTVARHGAFVFRLEHGWRFCADQSEFLKKFEPVQDQPAITTDDIYRLMRVIEALNARVAELERENRRLTSVPPSPDLPD